MKNLCKPNCGASKITPRRRVVLEAAVPKVIGGHHMFTWVRAILKKNRSYWVFDRDEQAGPFAAWGSSTTTFVSAS
jgi:hypothetical protein